METALNSCIPFAMKRRIKSLTGKEKIEMKTPVKQGRPEKMKTPLSRKRKRSREDSALPTVGSAKKRLKHTKDVAANLRDQSKSPKVKKQQKSNQNTKKVVRDRNAWDNGTADVGIGERKGKIKVKKLKESKNIKPPRSDSDTPACCATRSKQKKSTAVVQSGKGKSNTQNKQNKKKKNVKLSSSGSESWDNGANRETAKKKRKRKRKRQKKQNVSSEKLVSGEQTQQNGSNEDMHDGPALSRICDVQALTNKVEKKLGKSVDPRTKMLEKLNAGRFRYINEQLYSMSGEEAMKTLGKDTEGFKVYHQGYTSQVQRWPINPVDKIIKFIQKRPSSTVVADFGCGEAKIAQSVKNTVFSFDIVAMNKYVVVCDMAKVPLEAESVDLVVFCLSLMGTNLVDFITEANRVLRKGGILKIAEVASRFDDVKNFVRAFKRLGFQLQNKDLSNRYFYMFDFVKTGKAEKWNNLYGLELKPCVYKKR